MKLLNNFNKYGFKANFKGKILKKVDGKYIGYIDNHYRIVACIWTKNGWCDYEDGNVKYDLVLIKKDYGWRLPTIKELLTLVNYEKVKPTCDLVDTESYFYWSSSTFPSNTSGAWYVFFHSGDTSRSYKLSSFYVRCVRDTPTGLEWSKSSDESMIWDEAFEYAKTLTDDDVYGKDS